MSTHSWKSFVAGLGALALSCTGMHLPPVPGSAGELVQTVNQGAGAAGTAQHLKQDRSECEKLAAPPSVEEEYALGGAVALNWVQRGGGLLSLDTDEKLVRYINVVGKNLGAQSQRPTLRWTFGVLRTTESFNAISAPGGYVFVTLGLLRGVENEAQLAGVLAHEIAHITSKHVLSRYGELKVSQCQRAAAGKGGMRVVDQLGFDLTPKVVDDLGGILKSWNGVLDLNHHVELLSQLADTAVRDIMENGLDKDEEYAADELAVHLLVSAGYDPREYLEFLAKIPEGRNSFSKHPRKVERVKRLVALLDDHKQPSEDFPELPAGTQGLVQPPLPPEFASVKGSVAHGKP